MAGVLSRVPGLGGFIEAGQLGQQEQMNQLSQLGSVQGILAKAQAAQEQREMRGLLSRVGQESGGDPAKMVPALLQTGLPSAIKLAGDLRGLVPKPPENRVISPGGSLVSPNGQVVYQAPFKPDIPKEFAPPEVVRLQAALEGMPPNDPRRQAIQARLNVLTTRSPGVTVNMPQSSDLLEKDGQLFRVRIGKDGQIEQIPLGPYTRPKSPSEVAAERKDKEAKDEAELTMSGVRARVDSMVKLIQQGGVLGNVVGPLGAVNRGVETVAGMLPGMGAAPTPAIDYENEKNLLLADVRKLVEKDPNLSNQERETLKQTLGGGTIQTPGSAMRTLNKVIEYVESKKGGGGIRQKVEASGVPYEPNKYEYRVAPDGSVQRKAKQ